MADRGLRRRPPPAALCRTLGRRPVRELEAGPDWSPKGWVEEALLEQGLEAPGGRATLALVTASARTDAGAGAGAVPDLSTTSAVHDGLEASDDVV